MARESRAPQLEEQFKIYSVHEVADFLGKTERTVRQYIKDGKLKATKIGQWTVTEEALKEFLGLNK